MSKYKGAKEKRESIWERLKGIDLQKRLATIGIGITILGICGEGYKVDTYNDIAEVSVISDGSNSMSVPIKTQDGEKRIQNNSLVIVNTPKLAWVNPDQSLSVSGISDTGEYVTGEVSEKCLKKVGKISKKKLKKYNKILTVKGENVSFKYDPDTVDDNENFIYNIPEFTQVLASDNKKINNDSNWIEIIYIDETGKIREVYGRQQDFYENVIESDLEKNDNIVVTPDRTNNKNNIVKNITDIKLIINTDDESGVNLREDCIIDDDNVIIEIPNGEVVYALSDTIEENDNVKWRNIKYIDAKTQKEYKGWVANNYLIEDTIIPKIVNTDEVMGITLKLRETPGGEIIDEIKNGTKLNINFSDIIDMQINGNDRYIYTTLPNGKSGYIAYDYLEDDNSQKKCKLPNEESKNKSLSNYNITKNGDIVGIDISQDMEPEELEKMLKMNNAIAGQIKSKYQDDPIDTTEILGKINFVYIKIGASLLCEPGSIVRQNNINIFREQARVCEKYGVPYGFYYYSTCINEDEAEREAGYVNEAMNLLEDREYNILPMVVDFELNKNPETDEFEDRQFGAGDLTGEKALLAKLISEKYGNVVLYTSGFLISDESENKQLDLNRYSQIVGEKNVGLWIPAMMYNKVGEYGDVSQRDRDYFRPIITSSGKSYFEQIILDTNTNVPGGSMIDIDIIDENTYKKLIEGQYLEMTKALENKQDIRFMENENIEDGIDY